jgi:carboxyl-terminal processing protease
MKTSSTSKTKKGLLLAASVLLGLAGVRSDAAETARSRTAVRPQQESAAGYGGQEMFLPPGYDANGNYTGAGNFSGFGDYSQPQNYYGNGGNLGSTFPSDSSGWNAGYPHPSTTPTGTNWNGSQPIQLNLEPVSNGGGYWSGYEVGRNRDPYSNPVYTNPNYGYPTGTTPNYGGTPSYNQPSYNQPTYNLPSSTWPNGGYSPTTPNPNGGYPLPTVPGGQYQPLPTVPAQVNEGDAIATKITARYQNPEMLGFLQRMNGNQAMNLYVEASRLIDSRHVSPISYEARTRRAMEGLSVALENSAFLQASGGRADVNQLRALQQELRQLTEANPPRSANEAIGLMQFAADLANQRMGVRREAVALEFFNGTLDSLDKYSAFVPTKAAYGALDVEELRTAALEENIVGVGVELKKHDQGALVLGTVENGPAHRAGLVRGDIITGVDGQNIAGLSISQAANYISGAAGTPVTFRILRNGQQFTSSLRRENIYVSSVTGAQMLDRETGYVRLKQFSESSAEDLEKALWSLYRGGMKTIVLDLRGNPGGLLTEAVQVSDLFIPSGRIVATKGRTASDDSDEQATYEKTWRLPMVVLVDENSASASEIFAAAIQENRRGVIVGRNSYGKGTVQTHFPLQSVSGNLKLTTAKFYSPNGREMEGSGVRPDVAVTTLVDEIVTTELARDADVQMAMDVISRGLPAQLTAALMQTRR